MYNHFFHLNSLILTSSLFCKRSSYYGDVLNKNFAFVYIPMKNKITVTDFTDWLLIQITPKIKTLANTKWNSTSNDIDIKFLEQ